MSKPSNVKDEPFMKTARLPPFFNLEMTPPKPSVINPDVPMSVTLKNVTGKRQEVFVEVVSFLFELINPRAKIWPMYQIYHVMEPGATLSFQIGAIKETPEEIAPGSMADEDNCRMINRYKGLKGMKPEGYLQITHSNTGKNSDSDKDWGFEESEGIGYYILPGRRIVWYNEYNTGFLKMDLSCEKETELIKKRKEEFKQMGVPKKKEKKCCSCTVL